MLLDGVRVLDLTQFLPGGYCTRVLADLGATVTKVEVSTRGDPIRSLPNGEAYFEALHHGKPVVQLALKTEAGRARLLQLAETADVLLEGFRPGVMDRRQVGWDQLRAVNPRLIYCSITGYGSSGSLRDRAGHDLNYLARSGALSVMPRADGVPMIPGVQTADLAGGMMAAIAVLGAVVERQRTGRGRRLDVSMTPATTSTAPPTACSPWEPWNRTSGAASARRLVARISFPGRLTPARFPRWRVSWQARRKPNGWRSLAIATCAWSPSWIWAKLHHRLRPSQWPTRKDRRRAPFAASWSSSRSRGWRPSARSARDRPP